LKKLIQDFCRLPGKVFAVKIVLQGINENQRMQDSVNIADEIEHPYQAASISVKW